jgi:alkylation response protein AidB-like acyl-CoA dehydrogenase
LNDLLLAAMAPHDLAEHPVLGRIAAVLADPATERALADADTTGEYPAETLGRVREAGLASLWTDAPTTWHLTALNALCARASGSLGITVGVTALALLPVYLGGTDDQRDRAFARIRDGASGALLLTEWDHGSDLLRNEARADSDGDGYRLSGTKHLINGASRHDLLVALLRTRAPSDTALGAAGDFTLFLLDRDLGVRAGRRRPTLPCPAADIGDVHLESVTADAADVVGGVGGGAALIHQALAISRGGIAGLCAGTTARARGLAERYAHTRRLYGAPIAHLGAIAQHLASLAALDAVVAAIAVKQAAATNAQGPAAAPVTAAAKVAASALAERAVDEGRHVLGARALIEGPGYDRLVRDVLLYGVFDGTAHVVLEQLQWRLAQVAAAPDGPAQLDDAALAYAVPPRSLTERPPRRRTRPLSLARHLRALPAALPLDPLIQLAATLVDTVRALRASGRWDADQALRLDVAACHAELEALVALVELADPGCRAHLGLPPLAAPAAAHLGRVLPFAVGWLGARLVADAGLLQVVAGLDRARLRDAEAPLVHLRDAATAPLVADLQHQEPQCPPIPTPCSA